MIFAIQKYTFFLLALTLLVSCEKKQTFIHSDDQISYPCSCCEISDSIPGQYTGQLRIYDNSNWSSSNPAPGTIVLDTTITIDVARTFNNSDFISDSLLCQFVIPYFFSTQVIVNSDGAIVDPHTYQTQNFRLNTTQDTFQLHLRNNDYPLGTGAGSPAPAVVSYEFIGSRQ